MSTGTAQPKAFLMGPFQVACAYPQDGANNAPGIHILAAGSTIPLASERTLSVLQEAVSYALGTDTPARPTLHLENEIKALRHALGECVQSMQYINDRHGSQITGNIKLVLDLKRAKQALEADYKL